MIDNLDMYIKADEVESFKTLRIGANPENTKFFLYPDPLTTYTGTPDISFVTRIWIAPSYIVTHGCVLNCKQDNNGWSEGEGLGSVKMKDYVDSYGTVVKSYAKGERSVAFGGGTALGDFSFCEGDHTYTFGTHSHAEGDYSTAKAYCSHAEGEQCLAEGQSSHAEGRISHAKGRFSHAEGHSYALGQGSHSENRGSALGDDSHAEGYARAEGNYSHAEGYDTKAGGKASHAEGYNARAEGDYSHAEGQSTTAEGEYSHAEGKYSQATGNYSHSEGGSAIGDYSHTEGDTVAKNTYEHAQGTCNISHTGDADADKTIHSVGIGYVDLSNFDGENEDTIIEVYKNAHEIMKNGDHYFGDGKLYKGNYGDSTKEELATKGYVKLSGRTLTVGETAITIPSNAGSGSGGSTNVSLEGNVLTVGDTSLIIRGGWSKYTTLETLLQFEDSKPNKYSHPDGYDKYYYITINENSGSRLFDFRGINAYVMVDAQALNLEDTIIYMDDVNACFIDPNFGATFYEVGNVPTSGGVAIKIENDIVYYAKHK